MSAPERRPRSERPADRTARRTDGKTPPPAKAADAAAPELPELPDPEPAEETLDTLEPIVEDKSGIVVTVAAATDKAFDTAVQIQVPEMDKKALAESLPAPLARALQSAGQALRWRRIVVTFGGEAIIGSAVRDLIATTLREHKAAKVVVRRGYGDETVHEAAPPKAKVSMRADGSTLHVEVASFELESADLPGAMAAELDRLTASVRDKAVALQFTGAAPDSAFADHLHHRLADAGAVRGTIGGRLLFDRDLEARVQISGNAQEARIVVTPADDPAVTNAAFDLVLPGAKGQIAGRRVKVAFTGRAPGAAELDHLLAALAPDKPQRVELDRGTAEPDILWPALLHVLERDGQVVLGVTANGRSPNAIAVAFAREVGRLGKVLAGKAVTVNWPADFALDAATERTCLAEGLGALGCRSVHATFGGEHREPFLPPAITVTSGKGDLRTVGIDVDAGKPPEVVRAVERRLRATAELKGRPARIVFTGSSAPSRSLLRAAVDEVLRAGCNRVELDDRGRVDVLVPALLTIQKDGDQFRIVGDAGGRDAAQVQLAMTRELDAGGVGAGSRCMVAPGAVADELIAALVGRGAARVVLAEKVPVQVHPALFAAPERRGSDLQVEAMPGADASALPAQVARELPALLAKAGDLAATSITLRWPGARDAKVQPVAAALQLLVGSRPAKVLLDTGAGKPVQVFPEVVAPPAPAPAVPAAAAAAPQAAPAAKAPRAAVTVLGRKDSSTPRTLMLGIDAGGDAAAIGAAIADLAPQIEGRSVLLVLRRNERDVAAADADPALAAARAQIEPRAAAVLVFRGPRGGFEVVASNTAGLAVGGRFGDPRAARR